MHAMIDRLTDRSRNGSSLLDAGYTTVGLDDAWQDCGAGVNGSFNAADGTPLINKQRFPDLGGMCDYAHSKGLKCGWYLNNCICAEH